VLKSFSSVGPLSDKLKEQEWRIEELTLALKLLYDETADYITVNHRGYVHHNQSMKLAKQALNTWNLTNKE
jgi:hypothetical protein